MSEQTNTTEEKNTKPPLLVWLIFLPFITIGLGTLLYVSYSFYKSQVSKGWAKTIAVIRKVGYEAQSHDGATSYEVLVHYQYSIHNAVRDGNRIAFGYGSNNSEDHEVIFADLDQAKKIMVYVNPADEDESVIVPGINNSIIGLLIFSVLWNSLLLLFTFPVFIKKDEWHSYKKGLIIVCLIWFVGFTLILTEALHISNEGMVEIVELKESSPDDENVLHEQ